MVPSSRVGCGIIPYNERAAVGSIVDDATSIFDDIGNVLGDQHPEDKARKAAADQFAAAAMAGDRLSYLRLKCLSAIATPAEAAEYQQLSHGDQCGTGWATATARSYGAQKVAQVDAYLRSTGGDGGSGGQGPGAPGPIPGLPSVSSSTVSGLMKGVAAAAIALVILPPLFKKQRRGRR